MSNSELMCALRFMFNQKGNIVNIVARTPDITFYNCGSVHRNSRLKKSNKIQQYAGIYLLLNYSTCFGRPSRPSSGVHKTVVAASGTDRTIWEASFFKRTQINPYLYS